MNISTLFPLYLLLLGVYTGIRLRFFCFIHPIHSIRTLFSAPEKNIPDAGNATENTYSPWKALTVALAGTLGVGNITGVAAAIVLGGSGALFWMWISALCTMLIKYAEVVLAVQTRETIHHDHSSMEYRGGPMRYLLLLRHGGGSLAILFSVLCIAASFIQGNLIQTNAAIACLSTTFACPPLPTALVLTGLSALLIFGGRQRIAAFTEKMIPLMTSLYLVMGLTVIFRNSGKLPALFADIFTGAFSLRAVGGGVGGSVMLAAMRHGCAKGVFSHEAGCGTSPISHAGAQTDSAHRQGLLGIAEVAVDTLLLCTVTGLVLLLSGACTGNMMGTDDFASLVLSAFSIWFGDAAAVFLTISMVFYAFATLICWSFYGTECVRAVCRRPSAQRWYLVCFSLCTCLGALIRTTMLWSLSDLLTIAMTVLNATAVALLIPKISKDIPDIAHAAVPAPADAKH